jgi:hypothetical protein
MNQRERLMRSGDDVTLQCNGPRMCDQYQLDNDEIRNAAWRSLWQRLLSVKCEDLPQRRHDADDGLPATQRKNEA